MTLGAARSILTTGELVAKYMPVAPESTISVAFFLSVRCRCAWLDLTLLMFGKVEFLMSRVGLMLAV